MTVADQNAQLNELGALLESRVDELARGVVQSIRAGVAFYHNNDVVSDDDLFETAAGHLTVVSRALQDNSAFDTGPASVTGCRRPTHDTSSD